MLTRRKRLSTIKTMRITGDRLPGGPLRSATRLRLLDELYRHPATSRAELVRRTGLSRATVSSVVDELERAGLVGEHDGPDAERPRNTGRPPILLSLVPDAAFAVGLDFGHTHIRVAICDLAGRRSSTTGRSSTSTTRRSTASISPTTSCDSALQTAGIDQERLLGIGMGVAAPINKLTGDARSRGDPPGLACAAAGGRDGTSPRDAGAGRERRERRRARRARLRRGARVRPGRSTSASLRASAPG